MKVTLSPQVRAAVTAHAHSQVILCATIALHMAEAFADVIKAEKPTVPDGYSLALLQASPSAFDKTKDSPELKKWANRATTALKLAVKYSSLLLPQATQAGTQAGEVTTRPATFVQDDAEAFAGHIAEDCAKLGYILSVDDMGAMATGKLSLKAKANIKAIEAREEAKQRKEQEKLAAATIAAAAPAPVPPSEPLRAPDAVIAQADQVQARVAAQEDDKGEKTYIARCTDHGDSVAVDMGGMPDDVRMCLLYAVIAELGMGHCNELATMLATRVADLSAPLQLAA